MLVNTEEETAKVFSQHDKDKAAYMGPNDFSPPSLFPSTVSLQLHKRTEGEEERKHAAQLEGAVVRAKATAPLMGEWLCQKGKESSQHGLKWGGKKTFCFWALVCDDRKTQVWCRL